MSRKLTQNENEWGKTLTPEQYEVLRKKGTEIPFSGKLLREKRDGVYKCATCGNPLFSSDAKFESGTGWPSFDQALPHAVKLNHDTSHGMDRSEITCARCGSHLGHIFDDGPAPSGKRYCTNSLCFDFEPTEKK